ncbi:glycosyl transferase family 1 [Mycobacterium sp. IS-836]|uniref:glycosyltransferase n=1 Tax=Mycobacterium sp. IS-836 TaxID=1834160 RepID=UPI00096EA30D|nr:glycosyltransferase [Mycobacterium sp. IS-836]OMC52192.1 glycosyl transferase family 1 [Mycobacterium sp. IS-836]
MKFVLACYGTRGDVEPYVVVGRELLHRGHDVRMAVPPNLVGFVEAAGLSAVACGPDSLAWQELHEEFMTRFWRDFWKIRDLIRLGSEDHRLFTRCWKEIGSALTSLADGADLLVTFWFGEQAAVNVADYYGIPLATLHTFPLRAHGHLVPIPLARLGRSAMRVDEWVSWRLLTKKLGDDHRRELGLPKATGPASRQIAERRSLEIQAYHELCFPGLTAEWAKWHGQRPFVGALTMELPTDADEEVASWIAAGRPPIYFGFGSTAVKSAADILGMISAACAELDERALVCAGWSDFSGVRDFEHVKVVDAVNHSAIFPACRAVVHHGGAGTLAAALRAGVPQLILATLRMHQPIWGNAVKRMKVGIGRYLSKATQDSLVADLRTILDPEYMARAREIAIRTNKPSESAAAAADLLENVARLRCVG